MRNIVLLFLLMVASSQNYAQTKSELLDNISNTITDFVADLNAVNEESETAAQRISSIAETFGHPEYFIRNGENIAHLADWLTFYCKLQLDGHSVQHSMNILEHTFKKIDLKNENDKRYQVDAQLERYYFHNDIMVVMPEEKVTLTVVWKGNGQYAAIAGINGELKGVSYDADKEDDRLVQAAELLSGDAEKLWEQESGHLNIDSVQKKLERLVNKAGYRDLDTFISLTEKYMSRVDTLKQYQKEFQTFLIAAWLGDLLSASEVAFRYQQGIGVKPNSTKSNEWYLKTAKWFEKAASQGDASTKYNLGLWYEGGKRKYRYSTYVDNFNRNINEYLDNGFYGFHGIRAYPQKALEWFTESAEQGYDMAQLKLGLHYYGINEHTKAVEWYQKAAEQGNKVALHHLAKCYQAGKGVEENPHKAFEYWKQAAEKGYAKSQSCLGSCYKKGYGTTKDKKKAKFWFKKAEEENIKYHEVFFAI